MKTKTILFLLVMNIVQTYAQTYVALDANAPIQFNGNAITYAQQTIELGSRAFFVDGQLKNTECTSPYVFNSINEAFKHIISGTEEHPMQIYIAPYVYWIDDPDDITIRKPQPGKKVPFGLETDCSWLMLYGLTKNPKNVILASNRGQMQGAIGNFTMFNFKGDGLYIENLTMGNFCNRDLKYPLMPSLNRKKRTSTITQAQIAFAFGDKVVARNAIFVSRLNACPLIGNTRSLMDNCYIECGNDALSNAMVYHQCHMVFYSPKPFYSTQGTGSIFLDCDFDIHPHNTQSITKMGGQVSIIDSRFHFMNNKTKMIWTDYDGNLHHCYEANNKCKNQPFHIDAIHPWTSVNITNTKAIEAYRIIQHKDTIYNVYNLLRGNDHWNPMHQTIPESEMPIQLFITPHHKTIVTNTKPLQLQLKQYRFGNIETHHDSISWKVESGESFVEISNITNSGLTIHGNNQGDTNQTVRIVATSSSGLKASNTLTIKPSYLPAPTFISLPQIEIKKGTATVHYKLRLEGRNDESLVTWYRCTNAQGKHAIPVAVSRMNKAKKSYTLTQNDIGSYLWVTVTPKHSRCHAGLPQGKITQQEISKIEVKQQNTLYTNFQDFPTNYQPQVIPGFWTVDGCKPKDTELFSWDPMPDFSRSWLYDKGINGATGYGLLQRDKGARLRFTPIAGKYSNMSLTLNVSPAKTAGQGFGSATAQYLDICIKFNTKTLTGYGLRIERTPHDDHSVEFVLVQYKNGTVTRISDAMSSTCYRTYCNITLEIKGHTLIAHATTNAQIQSSKNTHLLPEVKLEATITSNPFGGIYFQHTGSAGASASMFNWLKVQWEK